MHREPSHRTAVAIVPPCGPGLGRWVVARLTSYGYKPFGNLGNFGAGCRCGSCTLVRKNKASDDSAYGRNAVLFRIRCLLAFLQSGPRAYPSAYQDESVDMSPNDHPAAGKAGIASRFAIGYNCPGRPEPGR